MNRKRNSIGTELRGRMHRRRRRSLAVRLLVAAAILFTCAGAAGAVFALSGFGRRARIQISTSDREVYVGEEQPPLLAEVTSDTERYNKRIRLDKKKKLTAEELSIVTLFPSNCALQPRQPSILSILRTSVMSGTFRMVTFSSVSTVAASMGSTEFFADCMRILPQSLLPPFIMYLSICTPYM